MIQAAADDADARSRTNTVLYARVSNENKAFVKRLAKKTNVSVAFILDYILDKERQAARA